MKWRKHITFTTQSFSLISYHFFRKFTKNLLLIPSASHPSAQNLSRHLFFFCARKSIVNISIFWTHTYVTHTVLTFVHVFIGDLPCTSYHCCPILNLSSFVVSYSSKTSKIKRKNSDQLMVLF